MRRLTGKLLLAGTLVATLATAGPGRAAARSHPARWTSLMRVGQVLDLSDQLPDHRIVIDQTSRLSIMVPGRRPSPFDRGYGSPGGDEPYMEVSTGMPRRACSFGGETVYLLNLVGATTVTAIDAHGRVSQFAAIPSLGWESGIALDRTGHFRYRLLVSVIQGIDSALYAIDCHGVVTTLAQHIPKVEGALAVAPASFGLLAGWLVGADELTGHVYGIPPDGQAMLLATIGPVGTDVGPESVGFVPRGFGAGWRALVADRLNPGYPRTGDDEILSIPGAQLRAAGVRGGDLLVVTEGGAHTFDLRCRSTCRLRHVADGPANAHVEGHVTFARWP